MAKTRVVYQYQKLDDNDYWQRPKNLCLVCAMKKAVQIIDPTKEKMYLATTDYESTQCDICGRFLEDEIEI